MKNGEQHGDWQWFGKNGEPLRTATFKNGERVSLP